MSQQRNYIPLSVPNLKGNEIKYVTQAIESEWISTAGPYVNEFEEKLAKYVKSPGAVSCQSGTAGLHTALKVLGVNESHEILVPTLTFIAAVNPVMYLNAKPVFMDCDDSLTIDPDKILDFCLNECKYSDGKLVNIKTKKHVFAIVVVHVFGNMADMVKIMSIADRFNLKIIEDATEALGTYYKNGKYKGKFAGTIGDIGVYSFNGNKIITTGGGGMIVSNKQAYLDRCKHLTTQAKSNELYFLHDEIGYNYRMTNIQAALGLAQLEKLEEFIKIKSDNYYYYRKMIDKIDKLKLLEFRSDIRPNYWFYSLFIDDNFKYNRDQLLVFFESHQIQTRPIWGLIHTQLPYIDSKAYKIDFANTYLMHVLNIPCSSNLQTVEIDRIIDLLETI